MKKRKQSASQQPKEAASSGKTASRADEGNKGGGLFSSFKWGSIPSMLFTWVMIMVIFQLSWWAYSGARSRAGKLSSAEGAKIAGELLERVKELTSRAHDALEGGTLDHETHEGLEEGLQDLLKEAQTLPDADFGQRLQATVESFRSSYREDARRKLGSDAVPAEDSGETEKSAAQA
eukprot:TRINITY_DN36013_c0_g1_i2.p1 TRINITY_DN36013_c0_g1~~TRINITY_DN36013_c0_g1_i2.p1  ORF type:complete len:177 (-),score=52.48 TRINITY_DN36013_c0_g1_i2:521-1051(-)